MFGIFGKNNDSSIYAPVNGDMIDIGTVSDETFAEKLLGDGVAFKVYEDKAVVYAPVSGTLETLFPTLHAFGIKTKAGVSILVHIGVNTVDLDGRGFSALSKKQGDRVKAGDPIVEVDFESIRDEYDTTVMMVILDDNGKEVSFEHPMSVTTETEVGMVK